MTQQTEQHPASNEFDAARIIVDTLKGLDRLQQERAIRFASEALGLHTAVASGRTAPPVSVPLTDRLPDSRPIGRPGGRALDIKQFCDDKSPKGDQQFAAVVAYYYKFEASEAERRETINAAILANAARLAVRRRPTRYALNNAKRQGYLDPSERGEFRISTVGENLVAVTLPNSSESPGRKRAKPSAKKRRRRVPR